MSKKKILIVGRTFYPEQSPRSFRTTELAKEFARQGHQVEVLLPQNLQEKIESFFDNPFGIKFMYFGPLKWKAFRPSKISWIGDWKRKFGRLLFLLLDYPNIEIYFKLPQKIKDLQGYDLMITIAVPHENHWAVAKVRNPQKPIAKVWVADCGDPFMGNTLETIRAPFYFSYLEKNFGRKADFISVPSIGAKKGYYKEFHSKIVAIPQGFDFLDIPDFKPTLHNDTLRFAYAGGVASSGIRSPKKLIAFLLESNISFEFHIYSNNYQILNELANQSNSICLHPPLPRKELLTELAAMDFLINLDNGTKNQTPSKLIDYMLVKKPILNIPAENFDTALVLSFLNRDYSQQLIIENIEQFNIKNVAHQFLSLGNESV